jgi:hypothetical protein
MGTLHLPVTNVSRVKNKIAVCGGAGSRSGTFLQFRGSCRNSMGHSPRLGITVFAAAWTMLAAAADAPVVDAVPPANSGGALDNPLARHTLGSLSATRDRPLFTPSRRPPPPPPVVVHAVEAAAPVPPPAIVLLGIVLEDDAPRALVRADGAKTVVRVQVGDEVGGWAVTAIEPRRLELSHDDRSASLELFTSATKGPARPVETRADVLARIRAQELMSDRSQRRR